MTESENYKPSNIISFPNELKEEGQLRRSERKKVPSLWYIEHLNEYKKSTMKKNPGGDQMEKLSSGSEFHSPMENQYLPFIQAPQFYEIKNDETRPGLVAFIVKHHPLKNKELNKSKNNGKNNILKPPITKRKPQRKFHQTFSSSNRIKAQKYERKPISSMTGNIHKNSENNNILDMILSAATKAKKDPSVNEMNHKKIIKQYPGFDSEKRIKNYKNDFKLKAMDNGGYIKKSIKQDGKLYFEHSPKGKLEYDFTERIDPNYKINYPKLFKSKLFEKCFNFDNERALSLEPQKIEMIAKEKLMQLKSSFEEIKKGSLILI